LMALLDVGTLAADEVEEAAVEDAEVLEDVWDEEVLLVEAEVVVLALDVSEVRVVEVAEAESVVEAAEDETEVVPVPPVISNRVL